MLTAFPRFRSSSVELNRVQDNVASVLDPLAAALGDTTLLGATPPVWIQPDVLGAGWAATGEPYAPPSYFLDCVGNVWVRGVITNGSGGGLATAFFTLPFGYRPAATWVAPAATLRGATPGVEAVTVSILGAVAPVASMEDAGVVYFNFAFPAASL